MSTRWTEADVARHQAKLGRRALEEQVPAKPAKYRNIKVVVDGEKFDSKREAQHWQELKLREKAGEISLTSCGITAWPETEWPRIQALIEEMREQKKASERGN